MLVEEIKLIDHNYFKILSKNNKILKLIDKIDEISNKVKNLVNVTYQNKFKKNLLDCMNKNQ